MKRWILAALLGLGTASAQLMAPSSSPDFTSIEPAQVARITSVRAYTGPEFSTFEFRMRNDGGRTFRNGSVSVRLIMDGVEGSSYPVSECNNSVGGPFTRTSNSVELSSPVDLSVIVEDSAGNPRMFGGAYTSPERLCDVFTSLITSPEDAADRPALLPGDVIKVRLKVYANFYGTGYTDTRATLRLQMQVTTDQGVAASDVSAQEIRPVWPRLKVGVLSHECFAYDPACSAQAVGQMGTPLEQNFPSIYYGSGQSFLVGGIMLAPVGESRNNASMTFAVPDVGAGCNGYGLGGLKETIIARRDTGAWGPLSALMPLQPGDRVTFGADTNGNGEIDAGDTLTDSEFVSVGVRCQGPLFGGQAPLDGSVTRSDNYAPSSGMVFW